MTAKGSETLNIAFEKQTIAPEINDNINSLQENFGVLPELLEPFRLKVAKILKENPGNEATILNELVKAGIRLESVQRTHRNLIMAAANDDFLNSAA